MNSSICILKSSSHIGKSIRHRIDTNFPATLIDICSYFLIILVLFSYIQYNIKIKIETSYISQSTILKQYCLQTYPWFYIQVNKLENTIAIVGLFIGLVITSRTTQTFTTPLLMSG